MNMSDLYTDEGTPILLQVLDFVDQQNGGSPKGDVSSWGAHIDMENHGFSQEMTYSELLDFPFLC